MSQGQLTITTRNTLLKIFLIFVMAVAITFCGWSYAIADEAQPFAGCPITNPPTLSKLEKELRGLLGKKLLTYEGCPEEMGAWYMLPMPQEEDRMQAVHAALLPNNKVLIVNGSSNRNRVTAENKIEDGVNTKDYAVVNNTSIFDPSLSDPYYAKGNQAPDFNTSPFYRIDSPPAEINGESNDPFCSGHLQLPNGDVLFIGGSRLYYPGVRFSGSKQANIYHWQEKDGKKIGWENLGLTKDGHWYPTLIPLADGAIASFSGFTADPSQIVSTLVEIYDPKLQDPTDPKKAWQTIDVKDLPNNPFKTRMNNESFGSDIIDLYARILPTKEKNRFLITGDGGGKNEPKIAHASVHSYFVTFNKDQAGKYSLSFAPGPERQAINKVYGTAVLDPSSPNGDVLLMGGIMGTNNIGIGPGKDVIQGATIVSSLERWKAPDASTKESSWEIDRDFFGKIDEDILLNTDDVYKDANQKVQVNKFPLKYKYDKQSSILGRYGKRAMEQAVILPTKEILVVNGGNYAETRPAYNPTLLIPDAKKTDHQGFRTKLMNPDVEPRLYHNTALLLPDARVLVMGGNNSRAARFDKDGTVRLDTKNDFAFVNKGTEGNSGEIWQHAIFYPPYLFGASDRPEIETVDKLQYGASQTISVNNFTQQGNGSLVLVKLGSVTHSFDNGQRLVDIKIDKQQSTPFKAPESTDDKPLTHYRSTITFTAPTDDHFTPPGYYMLFYLNSAGKPSHAKIVQLGTTTATATTTATPS